MTGESDKDEYYGAVNINTLSTYLLIAQINYIYVYKIDVDNDYIHGLTKESI